MAILKVVLTAVSPCVYTFKEAMQLSRSGHLSETGFWENTMDSPKKKKTEKKLGIK